MLIAPTTVCVEHLSGKNFELKVLVAYLTLRCVPAAITAVISNISYLAFSNHYACTRAR